MLYLAAPSPLSFGNEGAGMKPESVRVKTEPTKSEFRIWRRKKCWVRKGFTPKETKLEAAGRRVDSLTSWKSNSSAREKKLQKN